MKWQVRIKHPEWLPYSKPQQAIDLFLKGQLPPCIAGGMIMVGCLHPLRAVYGSDVRVAWALVKYALRGKLEDLRWNTYFRLFPPKDELSEMGEYEDHPCTKDPLN